MQESSYSAERAAKDTAEFIFETVRDLKSWDRISPRATGVPRYQLVFNDGERYTIEIAFDGTEDDAAA